MCVDLCVWGGVHLHARCVRVHVCMPTCMHASAGKCKIANVNVHSLVLASAQVFCVACVSSVPYACACWRVHTRVCMRARLCSSVYMCMIVCMCVRTRVGVRTWECVCKNVYFRKCAHASCCICMRAYECVHAYAFSCVHKYMMRASIRTLFFFCLFTERSFSHLSVHT